MMATTTERGYGAPHQRERERWRPLVEAGEVDCARCGEPIAPGQPWDLGHRDGTGKAEHSGPEHRGCNRGAGMAMLTEARRELIRQRRLSKCFSADIDDI
jgi:hypothetical protein